MLYRRVLLMMALVTPIGCGDNLKPASPDGGTPNDDGGTAACSLELEAPALAGGTWDSRFTVAGFSGPDGLAPTVYDFARDVDGSIVVAGKFDYLGGDHVEPLLRWKNGAWGPARTTWELAPPDMGFSAVAIDGNGRLALATYDASGERSGEIWLDDGTGLRVIGTFDGLVRTLAWYDDELWVAGWHEITSTTMTIQGLAVWNGTSWTPPPGGAVDGSVYELVHDGNELLIGGWFSNIGGISAASVAAFDGTAWRALDFPDVTVYALARGPDDQLYAGGTFGLAFGPTGGIARWTGTAWELASGGLGMRDIVGVATDLALHAGSLYVSGCFRSAGGQEDAPGAIITRDLARFDGQWHALDPDTKAVVSPWYEPRGCGDEGPGSVWDVAKQRLFSDGDRILLGGTFPGIDGVQSQAMIAYDGSSWLAQGPGGLGISGAIERIAASSSCDVWALGRFTHAAGTPTESRVLHFTDTGWEPVADSIPRDALCSGFAVSHAGEVTVGCMIFPADSDPVGRLYRVSGTQLVQVGTDLPLVMAIAYSPDGTLWVTGGTTTGAGFVGRLDGESLTIIEDGFDAPVIELDPVSATDLIVGGYFTKVDTLDASRIARWNGSSWLALGAGLPATPSAITHDDAKVYVSTADEGTGQFLLGAFDGTQWVELAGPTSGLTPEPYFNFNALRVVGGAIVAVGTAVLDDKSGRGALVFENGTFRALGGGGVGAITLLDLAVTSDAIWIAGDIAEAGTADQATSTVGIARYVIAR